MTLPPHRELRIWVILAVGALALAGALAALLAASRVPGVSDHLPLHFFKVALVTHVIFSFVIWYLVMLGAYCCWALLRMADRRVLRASWLGDAGLVGVATSFILLLIPALFGLGEPSLNDYVPMVDHPLFHAGIVCLLASVALPVLRLVLNLSRAADGVTWGIAAAGTAYLAALVCFALGWWLVPQGSSVEATYQAMFWGGGHVLQFVHTALILVIWWVLLTQLHGHPPASGRVLAALCGSVALVAWIAPVFYGLWDSNDANLDHAFTRLYALGLIVQPALGMGLVAMALLRRGWPMRSIAGAAVVFSWLLFALGGAMGYTLTSSDTRTPAHYHAMIGAVTLAHMAMICTVLLPALGRAHHLADPLRPSRWGRGMVWLYALGQIVHAGGLYVAGTYGIARKTAGSAQGLEGAMQKGAMIIMGLGGGIAVLGGVVFVVLALRHSFGRPALENPFNS